MTGPGDGHSGRSSDARLPAYVEELLAAERTVLPPSGSAQERVRARIAATVVAAGAVGAAGTAGAATSAAGATAKVAGAVGAALSVKTSLLVVAIAAGATAAGGIVIHQRREQPPKHAAVVVRHARQSPSVPTEVRARPPEPLALPEKNPPAPAEAAATPAPRVPRRQIAAPAVGDVKPAPSAAGLTEENVPIAAALSALARGVPADAIAALEQHAHKFPAGQLEEEREALWIQALVAAGDGAGARARAERFRRRFPGSIQQEAVSAALETIR